jgi:hypothetical protein
MEGGVGSGARAKPSAITLRVGGENSFLAGNGQRRVSSALRDFGIYSHQVWWFWFAYVKPQIRDAEFFSHLSYKIEEK